MTRQTAAVFFDLDDTLIDDGRATRAGVERLLLGFPGAGADPVTATGQWNDAVERHFPRFLAGELTLEAVRTVRLRDWADGLGLDLPDGAEPDHIADFLAGYEAGWVAFDDVEPAVALLAGLRLGVITNGHGPQQRQKLDATGLTELFEVVVASTDVGAAKPDREIFLAAAALLGVDPTACVHVGDHPTADVAGAASAGFTAVWLDRRGGPGPPRRDVLRITSLLDLPALLNG